jgi:Gluconate 2-dehydrogenase subunit 3
LSDTSEADSFDRRELLRRAMYVAGGAAALAEFGNGEAWAADVPAAAPYFTADRMALLAAIADSMIPGTDTAGAVAVGASVFVDAMMRNWASENTRAAVDSSLQMIDVAAISQFGTSFARLGATNRNMVLVPYDANAIRTLDPGYVRLKELILTGYYLSEFGATKELRYIHAPGAWRADIPFAEIGRAWAVG